jgi:hypothetical protein
MWWQPSARRERRAERSEPSSHVLRDWLPPLRAGFAGITRIAECRLTQASCKLVGMTDTTGSGNTTAAEGWDGHDVIAASFEDDRNAYKALTALKDLESAQRIGRRGEPAGGRRGGRCGRSASARWSPAKRCEPRRSCAIVDEAESRRPPARAGGDAPQGLRLRPPGGGGRHGAGSGRGVAPRRPRAGAGDGPRRRAAVQPLPVADGSLDGVAGVIHGATSSLQAGASRRLPSGPSPTRPSWRGRPRTSARCCARRASIWRSSSTSTAGRQAW